MLLDEITVIINPDDINVVIEDPPDTSVVVEPIPGIIVPVYSLWWLGPKGPRRLEALRFQPGPCFPYILVGLEYLSLGDPSLPPTTIIRE